MTPESYSSRVDQLVADLLRLSSFLAANEWHERAAGLQDELENQERSLRAEMVTLDQKLGTLREERARLPFFERLFSSQKPERALLDAMKKAGSFAEACVSNRTRLRAAVSRVPRTSVERDSMVKALRADKQRLGIEKKELALEMRTIRTQAKASSDALQPGFFTSKEVVAAKRRQIRADKDERVAEKQGHKGDIEARVIEIERQILWLQSLSNDGVREMILG